MAAKKKMTDNQKRRAKALADMRESLEEMKSNAESLLEQIETLLQAESPEEVIEEIGECESYGDSIVADAKNIPTIEFPEEEEEAE